MANKSRRAARVERHHKRSKDATLSLTSLMDIFTILVFFLLVNSSSEQPPTNKELTLPLSTANKAIKTNPLILMVSQNDILVQGLKVADANEAKKLKEDSIPLLLAELRRQSARIKESTLDPEKAKEITIMGDKEIPYKLLRKLMFTCTESDFSKISLAVMKKAGDK